ncbi:MAG TPA: SDR family oxidoreductase [Candidatus Limnocylindrales bacterium]
MTSPRILVVGANGMLGHQAIRTLAPDFEVWGACRRPEDLPDLGVPRQRILGGLDATRKDSAMALIEESQPALVINAAGIVKQREQAKAAIPSISVNSLWPHVLAEACTAFGARMVHVSTDCVFSGARGMYVESDPPDDFDLYGRSKLLGEVTDRPGVVTLRTSIIGWQLGEPTGLVAWFAAHRGEPLKGFTKAIFSGLTTRALTEVIRDVVLPDQGLSGLWHVSADPVDKYSLLVTLAMHLGWDVDIRPVDQPVIDRSLDSSRFRDRTGWRPRSWDEMLAELAGDYPGAVVGDTA